MFDSGISAKNLIAELKNDIDVATEIPNSAYITFLNSLEQMLYADFIKEQAQMKIPNGTITEIPSEITLDTLPVADNEDKITFEDIYSVYVNHNLQLIKTSAANGQIFGNSYYKNGGKLIYNVKNPLKEIRIIYTVKPKPKTVNANDEIQEGNVNVPIEFIELVKAKIRYEAYMLVNEFGIAANWVNVYNSLLTAFGEWLSARAPQFGQ